MKKFIVYLVALAATILLIFYSFSKAFEIGLTLRETHVALEIGYYVVLIIVLYFLLLRPIFIILFSPYYYTVCK